MSPFSKSVKRLTRSGLFYVYFLATFVRQSAAFAEDGATEALWLRLAGENAAIEEERSGNPALARAMEQVMPALLLDYQLTRDGTMAIDAVDAAFVEEQMRIARAIEEPGVALALEVFTGPGTGAESAMRRDLANLASYEGGLARISEKTLDAHERVMGRQLERIEKELEKADTTHERLDSKLEAKLEARLDTVAQRLEQKAEKVEEKTPERVEEKTEKIAEKAPDTIEKIAEKTEEKTEKTQEKTEKAEEKTEKIAEKAPDTIEKIAEKTEEKTEKKDKE